MQTDSTQMVATGSLSFQEKRELTLDRQSSSLRQTLQQAQWSFAIPMDREPSTQGDHRWGQQAACYGEGSPVGSIIEKR